MENLTASPAETTDISFLKDVVVGGDSKPASTEKPAAEPVSKTEPAADPIDPAKVDPTKTVDPAAKTEPAADPKPTNDAPQDPIDLSDEDVNDIISQASGGRLNSIDELEAKLARLEELEQNPSALFSDPNKRTIFEFLNKYQGSDFNTGLQQYGKLQKMDLESMDAETALKEVHMIESLNKGLTQEDAEKHWDYLKAEKYDSKGDIGETLKKFDAVDAKAKLAELKQATTVPKVDTQQEQAAAKAQENRESYLSQVEYAIQNEQGQFKSLKISFSDNPEDDFNYEVEDPTSVNESLRNYGDFCNQRYGTDGNYNVEQMKVDLALIHNGEAMMQKIFEHGINVGKERNMKERTNTPAVNTPVSNAQNNSSLPSSLSDSIMAGIKR